MKGYKLNEWVELDEYKIIVTTMKEESTQTGSAQATGEIRAVRIHVAYENRSDKPFKFVALQWLLFDQDGYSYESEILRKLYGDDAPRKLQEGRLSPGKSVQGWVAFQLPKDARPAYVQFRKNYMADTVADISLKEQVNKPLSIDSSKQPGKTQAVTCTYCGISYPEFRSFCLGCGAALPKPD